MNYSELMEKLGLCPRRNLCNGGLFKYFDRSTELEVAFWWDGAGIDSDGRVVIMEAEGSRPVILHIQGHLARLALMQSLGENVSRMVWIVEPTYYRYLRQIVESWDALTAKAGFRRPLAVEFWSPQLERLGFIPASQFS